jgi:hypothetical protein
MSVRNAASVQSAHIEFLERELSKARRENRNLRAALLAIRQFVGIVDDAGGSISSKEPPCAADPTPSTKPPRKK